MDRQKFATGPDGLITGFRTNLYDAEPPDEVIVTVTAPEADILDTTQKAVSEALSALPVPVIVRFNLP